MERSQLPLLRKKKGSKELARKEKESPKNEKFCQGKIAPENDSLAASDPRDLRDSTPENQKTLKATPKGGMRSVGNALDPASRDGIGKSRSPVDLEWSKYMVKGGSPSDNYQKFIPEKSATGEKIQKCSALQKSNLPHQVGQSCFSPKFSPKDGSSPSSVKQDSRAYGSPGPSTAPSVFTFDHKHLYDPDSSPIYHELDPIDGCHPPVNHTYQSITEIREEVERLQSDSAGNFSVSVQSHSGSARSPVRSNSGSVLSSVQNGSSKRHLSRTLPSPLPKPLVPRSPTLVSPAHSPTVAPQTSRSQSIFSKLWLQKRNASSSSPSKKDNGVAVANGNDATAPASPTARNLSLEAICVDVPKIRKANKPRPSVYAVTSPPPITASVFANYYQNIDRGRNGRGDAQRRQDQFDYYGLPSERNLRLLCGPSKRSFSDSTSGQLSSPKGKGQTDPVAENCLPWRTCRDLSPGGGRSVVDRWDVVRFGEPLDSHISGGGTVSLETFKGSPKSSSKPNKAPVPSSSSPVRHAAGKVSPGQAVTTPPAKREPPTAKKRSQHRTRPTPEATDRSAKSTPTRRLHRTQLSKSQENVLSSFSFDLLCPSAPGSFESLLSEDDVFLPGSSERLNVPVPPPGAPRPTFSSPSCGIRMAELRAGRRKSDSKSPSPEPPASTPPPFHPFLKIPAPCRIETVVKQDAAVQTSPTKSPVRLGGLSPHRYMHTIIEEDHSDQGSGSDGKPIPGQTDGKIPGENTCSMEKSRRCEGKIGETVRSRSDRSSGRNEGRRSGLGTGDLLGAISAVDDDDSSGENGAPGEIKPSRISCPSGNDRPEETDAQSMEDTDAPSSPRLQKTPSITDFEDRLSRMSPDLSSRSLSVGSETESATPSPVSLHEGETTGRRPLESRLKTSKLRPPKPARFFAKFGGDGPQNGPPSIANQCRDEPSELSRFSSGLSKPRVGEIRPLAPPLKQFGDLLPRATTDPTKIQALIKHASVKSIEPIGTGRHVTDEAKPSVQRAPEVPSHGPPGPLKVGRNGAQHKGPPVQNADPKRNISHLKSPFDTSSGAGSQDRIDAIGGGTGSEGTPAQRQRLPADFADASPVCCTRSSDRSSPSIPPRCETVAATGHSSLSSSLTSSSSSVYSVADSESEGTAVMRPPRKDPLATIGRPGGTLKSGDVMTSGKTVTIEGKGHERSRLALPRISVSRCKDMIQLQSEDTVKQESLQTDDDNCDEEMKTEISSSTEITSL